MHLAVHEQGVEDPAAVVDGDVTQQPRVARLRVDLDDRDVRPERERRVQLAERARRRQPGLHASASRDGSSAAAASSAHVIARSGAPATSKRPPA